MADHGKRLWLCCGHGTRFVTHLSARLAEPGPRLARVTCESCEISGSGRLRHQPRRVLVPVGYSHKENHVRPVNSFSGVPQPVFSLPAQQTPGSVAAGTCVHCRHVKTKESVPPASDAGSE